MESLEDRAMMERMAQAGQVRTTLEERFQALYDVHPAKRMELEWERWLDQQLLVRRIGRRFGLDMAEHAAELLAGTGDPDRLEDLGEWIGDFDTGSELLARLKVAA